MNNPDLAKLVDAAAPWPVAQEQARDWSRAERAQYGAWLVVAGVVLAVARYLQPDGRGYGTHEQLGLPTCTFLALTGIPCPSCGLTTSFAHAAHGHFYAALVAQPFGLLAFWLTLLSIPATLYLLHRRIAFASLLRARAANRSGVVLLALYLLSWIYKIVVMI
jgi:hypothetical protein